MKQGRELRVQSRERPRRPRLSTVDCELPSTRNERAMRSLRHHTAAAIPLLQELRSVVERSREATVESWE